MRNLAKQFKKIAHKCRYDVKKVLEYIRYIRPFAKDKEPKNNITDISIFSEPRSGSTWLAELFCQLPKSIYIYEPLFLIPSYSEIKELGLCFNQFIPEDVEWKEVEEFFRKLYAKEICSFSSLRLYYHNSDLRSIKSAKNFIYKDVNSSMLLPWLTKRFSINPIYIIRHPCAVIASQMKFGNWDYIQKDVKAYFPNPADRFKEIYEIYSDIIKNIRLPEERLAAEWAMHTSVPINHPDNNKRWITLSYEKIYQNPLDELSKVFDRLAIQMPSNFLDLIRVPSKTAIKSSVTSITEGTQLESWKKSLSKEQINNINNIVKQFNMDIYDSSGDLNERRAYNY